MSPDSLITTLRKISDKSKIHFAYDPDQLRSKRNPAFNFVQTPLAVVLERLLSNIQLNYDLMGTTVVITPAKRGLWTIHGRVRDQSNGEDLVGAVVQIPELDVGIATNQYGFFSITIPAGTYELLAAYPGYQTRRISIRLNADKQQDIELDLNENQLEEVLVRKPLGTPNPILLNEQNFGSKQIHQAGYYSGEADIMKRLQMENGLKALTEGSSGIFVRGGNADQNLILLDEAIVYNPSHLYGLVSVFNADVVNNVQVYKDYMPSNFGGRLSSVIVNRMTEGNNKEFHLHGGLSLMSARITAEGPIVKDQSSFIIAYRRSLLDVFHNKFKLFNPNSVYHDLNAKANLKLDKNNNIYYSMYIGKDYLLSENSYTNKWGNLTSTLRWNHVINSKIFLNMSLIFSNYNNYLDLNADTLSQKSEWNTGVKDLTLKADYTYYKSPFNQIKFGISSIYHRFFPGEMVGHRAYEFNISRDKSLETSIYYSQQYAPSKYFEFNYGLRLSVFRNQEEQRNLFNEQGDRVEQYEVSNFFRPEPRLNISYLPANNQRLYLTYNLNYQYLHLVQNSTLAFSSLEPWIPSSSHIKPQQSNHFSLGYRYSPPQYLFSVSTYYKLMDHLPDLIGHARVIRNPEMRTQLRSGESKAWGVELEIFRTFKSFTGTAAYTYSRVHNNVQGINFGERYATNYDIPHEIKLTGKVEVSSRLAFQSFFTYSTGRPITLPVGYYQHDGINVPIFEGRNSTRFPGFNRLDISAQYGFKSRKVLGRSISHVVSAGIYNLYNRKNPLYYHLNSSSFESTKSIIEYGFGFYPWIAYNFKI